MHFYWKRDGQLKLIPQSKYHQKSAKLPDVCFAIKYPIKNMQHLKLPFDTAEMEAFMLGDRSMVYHEGVKCEETKDDIIGPRYYAGCVISTGTEKRVNYSEEAFFKTQESDIDPLVFVRMARPVAADFPLPMINLSHFYEQSE